MTIKEIGALVSNVTFPMLASLFWLWTVLSYLRLRSGHSRYWLLVPAVCFFLALSNMMLSLSIAPATRIEIELGRAYSRLALTSAAGVLAVFTVFYLREALGERKE